jgi:hypothetical protein
MRDFKSLKSRERGVALIMALLLVLVLSTLAASLIFLTNTEVWSTNNYQLMMQARYGAEMGAQRATNWLVFTYVPPSSLASFDLTKSPVQYSGKAVVLGGTNANYPDNTVSSAFNTALSSQSVPGLSSTTYSASATLLAIRQAGSSYAQTWQVTSQGSVSGVRNAQVQVVQTIEWPAGQGLFNYGIAANSSGCASIAFTGGFADSWNSNSGAYAATHTNSGQTVATNGNVTLSGGSTQLYGTIYDSNNTNAGSCPDAVTSGGTCPGATCPYQGLGLISPFSNPAPPAPSPMTPNVNLNVNSNTCWGASPAGCTTSSTVAACNGGSAPCVHIAPNTPSTGYGNITSNSNVHLTAGTYYINSLSLNGGTLTLDSYPVIINLGGNGITGGGTLFTSNSGTTINDGGLPAHLLIESAAGAAYDSTSPPVITMNSSSQMYAAVYAPYAFVHITGSSQFLGAVVGYTVKSDSSGGYSFDRALLTYGGATPTPVLTGFSWSKF